MSLSRTRTSTSLFSRMLPCIGSSTIFTSCQFLVFSKTRRPGDEPGRFVAFSDFPNRCTMIAEEVLYARTGLVPMSGRREHPRKSERRLGAAGYTYAGLRHL